MATANFNEVDDFVTCGVCLCEYDEAERKPKFLPCAHSVCLSCLQAIYFNGPTILCPFCRNNSVVKNVTSLPTNSYALHMIKMKEEKIETPVKHSLLAENPQCATLGHVSFNMTADTIRNMESLLNLKEELFKLKDRETNNLAKAIKKRKEVQKHLTLILKSIKAASIQVKQLENENNLLLTEMVSLVEANNTADSLTSKLQDAKTNLFLQELLVLVNDSSPDDSPEILKMKMKKSVEISEQKLREATAITSEYQLHQKAKITIQMSNENGPIPTCSLLDKGFCLQPSNPSLKASDIRQDLTLISHGIFTLLQRPSVVKNNEPPETNNASPSLLASSLLSNNKFDPCTSLFIMRLFKLGVQMGELLIRPTFFGYPELVQQIGDFCYKSPKDFCYALDEAVPGAYVYFKMVHKQFPASCTLKSVCTVTADKIEDVGIILLTTSQPGSYSKSITGWNFVFPLEGYKSTKKNPSALSMENAMRFGHVIHRKMLESITALSYTKKVDRTDYSLTLESI